MIKQDRDSDIAEAAPLSDYLTEYDGQHHVTSHQLLDADK